MAEPSPDISRAEMMSVSEALDMLECGYRLAFAWDPAVASPPDSAAAALGTLVHAVAEWIGKGGLLGTHPEDARQAVVERWDEEEDRIVHRLGEQWHPAVPPAPEAWPGYHLTKERMLRRAVRLTGLPPREGARAKVESWLEDEELGLRGRVDRVEDRGGQLWVVDLKTGIRQGEVTDRQRQQLLLYAALVERRLGRRVQGVAIEQTGGVQLAEEVAPGVVERLLETLEAARRSWIAASAAGDPQTVASPSEAVCRWCPYRATCDPYWAELMEDWSHGSIEGIVISTSSGPPSLVVLVERPRDASGEQWTVAGSMHHLEVNQGVRVRVVEARPTGRRHAFRAEWSTQVVVLR